MTGSDQYATGGIIRKEDAAIVGESDGCVPRWTAADIEDIKREAAELKRRVYGTGSDQQ